MTTEDIVAAILRTTRPEGKVWRAASVLGGALKSKAVEGLRPESIIGQSDNWKDIIARVEKEDDIICLYRKNTEETAKKSEDWQKFLKTVSPGYTVHLAIDTGVKYVICLKKIDVPEATSQLNVSSPTPTTLIAESSTAAEATSAKSTLRTTTTAVRSITIPSSAMKKHSNHEKNDSMSEEEEKCCSDEELEYAEDNEHEDKDVDGENTSHEEFEIEDLKDGDEDDYSLDNSFEKEMMDETETMEDLSEESEYYKGSIESGRRGMISAPTGLRRFNSKNLNRSSYPSVMTSEGHGGFTHETSKKDPQCDRPIIFVVQPGKFPLPLRLPVQRRMVPLPMTSIPRTPGIAFGWPRQSFNPLEPAINYPRAMGSNNLVKPIQSYSMFMDKRLPPQNFPRNTNFGYKLPTGKMRVWKSMKRPILQKREPSVAMPRRVELPVSHGRSTVLPIDGQSVLRQWPQRARGSAIPRVVDRSDLISYNFKSRREQERKAYLLRQLMVNQLNSRTALQLPIYKPVFNSVLLKPTQPSIVHSARPWILGGTLAQEKPKVNRVLPVKPIQNIDRSNPQPINSFYDPLADNFIEPRQRQSMRNPFSPMIHRSLVYGSPVFDDTRGNGACIKDPADQLQPYAAACQNPCDRPIRLQIVIQSDVKESSKVSMLTEPGERVEIFGSGYPVMPYRSRSDTSGTLVRGESAETEEEIEPEVVEVQRRMDNVANDKTAKDVENKDETFSMDDTSAESDESESDESSTLATGIETMSDKVNTDKIGERFLDETTIETTSGLEANSTMPAITNSTLIA